METKEWIMIVSALIVATGWFVTGHLNRQKDIAQRRMEYRLEALEAFLPVWFSIQENSAPFSDVSFLAKLENARSKFHLYCYQDEIDLMEGFIKSCENQNLTGANASLEKLMPLVRSRIRAELKINA